MSLWSRWFPGTPPLDPAAAQRLAAWQALSPASETVRLDQNRFVVMDVETTGLSLTRDHLIAIGAVAVKEGRIDLDDSFEVVLQQETSSGKDNILIHGIGGTAQTGGIAPVEALLQFLEYLGTGSADRLSCHLRRNHDPARPEKNPGTELPPHLARPRLRGARPLPRTGAKIPRP